jgi:hypothetical protein
MTTSLYMMVPPLCVVCMSLDCYDHRHPYVVQAREVSQLLVANLYYFCPTSRFPDPKRLHGNINMVGSDVDALAVGGDPEPAEHVSVRGS